MFWHYLSNLLLISYFAVLVSSAGDEDESATRLPNKCEVCKLFALELEHRMKETDKVDVLHMGSTAALSNNKKKSVKYKKSELRFIETLHEPHICDRFLSYDVHKEREGSTRWARGRSETMQTLHDLVKKGTKVDIGIPFDMWDKPSVEITHLQKECYQLVERFEDELEEWYMLDDGTDAKSPLALTDWLCRQRVLRSGENGCLDDDIPESVLQNHRSDL